MTSRTLLENADASRRRAISHASVLYLSVTRSAVTLQGPARESETTRALVALCIDGFRVGIVAVGEDEAELRKQLVREAVKPRGGLLATKILEQAQKHESPDGRQSESDPLRFFRAGEDAYWDRKWQDPHAFRAGDPKRAANPREILLVEPLSASSWSPHLIRGLLMFALWSSSFTRYRTWPPFLRPRVELSAAGDLSDLEYAELVDQLRSLWGERRVALPEGRIVPPQPLTTSRIAYLASRGLGWAALAISALLLVLQRISAQSSNGAVIAAVVAAVAMLVSRAARGRMATELPRRSASTGRALAP